MVLLTALPMPPDPSLAGEPAKGEAMTDGETPRAEMIEVVDSVIRPAEIYQGTPVENDILTDQDIEEFPAITPIEDLNEIPSVRIQTRGQRRPGLVSIAELPHKYSDLLVNGQRYSREIQEEMDLGDLLFMGPEKIEIPAGRRRFASAPASDSCSARLRSPACNDALVGRGHSDFAGTEREGKRIRRFVPRRK